MAIKGTQTEKNLLTAFAGESQARNRYTYFAGQARKDGYVQIADIFEETANQEKEHAKRFFKFLEGGDVEPSRRIPLKPQITIDVDPVRTTAVVDRHVVIAANGGARIAELLPPRNVAQFGNSGASVTADPLASGVIPHFTGDGVGPYVAVEGF